jgi:hypothetical protein
MKVPPSVLKVLTNKYVLYFVLFLAVTNVLGYMVMGQFTAALFFIVIAYLISNFSKNMIIVLGAALLLTNILMVGNTVKEGMENNGTDATATDTTATASAAAAGRGGGAGTPLSPAEAGRRLDGLFIRCVALPTHAAAVYGEGIRDRET